MLAGAFQIAAYGVFDVLNGLGPCGPLADAPRQGRTLRDKNAVFILLYENPVPHEKMLHLDNLRLYYAMQ